MAPGPAEVHGGRLQRLAENDGARHVRPRLLLGVVEPLRGPREAARTGSSPAQRRWIGGRLAVDAHARLQLQRPVPRRAEERHGVRRRSEEFEQAGGTIRRNETSRPRSHRVLRPRPRGHQARPRPLVGPHRGGPRHLHETTVVALRPQTHDGDRVDLGGHRRRRDRNVPHRPHDGALRLLRRHRRRTRHLHAHVAHDRTPHPEQHLGIVFVRTNERTTASVENFPQCLLLLLFGQNRETRRRGCACSSLIPLPLDVHPLFSPSFLPSSKSSSFSSLARCSSSLLATPLFSPRWTARRHPPVVPRMVFSLLLLLTVRPLTAHLLLLPRRPSSSTPAADAAAPSATLRKTPAPSETLLLRASPSSSSQSTRRRRAFAAFLLASSLGNKQLPFRPPRLPASSAAPPLRRTSYLLDLLLLLLLL
mmetsp:Transcript_1708/g.5099  ORF Transcript_1708/g.5099 Transcript_1708/m.5099 type:complete len:421 (+) Transcript_1708:555-1817(+)